jgi:hypothetical protein
MVAFGAAGRVGAGGAALGNGGGIVFCAGFDIDGSFG